MANRSREEWRELVWQWEHSGQTKQSFARATGVNAKTLGWWAWKLRREVARPVFLEVVVEEPATATVAPDFEIEVEGIRVRVPLGFDGAELRRLVDALC